MIKSQSNIDTPLNFLLSRNREYSNYMQRHWRSVICGCTQFFGLSPDKALRLSCAWLLAAMKKLTYLILKLLKANQKKQINRKRNRSNKR